ncbi:MAG: sulfur oxidation c-type cytochrome SoxX [Gammaproteobacteria bacterium]|jgi:sulfur-oxidizing protein SoxX
MQYPMFSKNGALATVFTVLQVMSLPLVAQEEGGASVAATGDGSKTAVEQGKAKAIELCQACHQFKGADQAGTVGPPLLAMKARFPDPAKLQALIYDAQKASKPYTMMPPFGRNGLVSEQDIEHIIAFLYTL